MLLTLQEAQAVNANATQSDIDALEASIRETTNNNFQIPSARIRDLVMTSAALVIDAVPSWIRVGETLQISATALNDGLYVVESIEGTEVVLASADFIPGTYEGSYVTLVRYPADVKAGALKILDYSGRTAEKLGIKSETISRYNVTYFDLTAGESKGGYPAYLMQFLDNYRKIGWGL